MEFSNRAVDLIHFICLTFLSLWCGRVESRQERQQFIDGFTDFTDGALGYNSGNVNNSFRYAEKGGDDMNCLDAPIDVWTIDSPKMEGFLKLFVRLFLEVGKPPLHYFRIHESLY